MHFWWKKEQINRNHWWNDVFDIFGSFEHLFQCFFIELSFTMKVSRHLKIFFSGILNHKKNLFENPKKFEIVGMRFFIFHHLPKYVRILWLWVKNEKWKKWFSVLILSKTPSYELVPFRHISLKPYSP